MQLHAAKAETRKPGHYAIWASSDSQRCKTAVDVVNGIPLQNLERAAYIDKRPGFLQWKALPALDLGLSISYIAIALPDGTPKYVLLWSTYEVSRVGGDVLYLVDTLPKNREDMRQVFARHEAFNLDRDPIGRLQRDHGVEWQNWYLSTKVYVVAFDGRPPTFFASEPVMRDSTARLLVFEFDDEGQRKDLCMLRRICSCAPACGKPFTEEREKAQLIPSAQFCRRSRPQ
jgi:hypothetical protein